MQNPPENKSQSIRAHCLAGKDPDCFLEVLDDVPHVVILEDFLDRTLHRLGIDGVVSDHCSIEIPERMGRNPVDAVVDDRPVVEPVHANSVGAPGAN